MDSGDKQANYLLAVILGSLGLGIRIAGVVVVAVLGSLFLGLRIDRELGSSPWATLLLLGLGTLVAVTGCYRVVAPVVRRLTVGQEVEWGAFLSWREFLSSLAFVAGVGLTAVAPLLAGLFLGRWMDGWLDTRPWAILILTVAGALAGLVGAWRLSSRFVIRMTKGNQEEDL